MSKELEKKEEKNELTVEYEVEGQKIKLTPSIVQLYLSSEKWTIL